MNDADRWAKVDPYDWVMRVQPGKRANDVNVSVAVVAAKQGAAYPVVLWACPPPNCLLS
jgi:hypothetical protein